MTALQALRDEIARTGYHADAIVSDYVFSDVLAAQPKDRRTPLAAFTQTPPSYRSAALAVVDADGRDVASIVAEHRALGAPLLFLIDDQTISVWQVKAEGPPREIARTRSNELPALFSKNREVWSPLSIHRAKSIGQVERTYQLDFVDAGLLSAIEGEIHSKLDRLLGETLADTVHARSDSADGEGIDDRALFRTTFRLLAAKVLQDRGHELASRWDSEDIDSVLDTISAYYRLPRLAEERVPLQRAIFGAAWNRLRAGISFRNISADDLAFVYENTLVTPETRRHFGTHSTPRRVADYLVSRLELWRPDRRKLRIYEPFAGAGVFLVAALRHLRDTLPVEWTEQQRHDFLVQRIAGDDIDAFACEVAALSLILADYPSTNGWQVSERDLMVEDLLAERLASMNVVLCNPPFGAFTEEERVRYPQMAARAPTKAAAVLGAVLERPPMALGFVLPRAFLDERRYRDERRRVEALYADIELVALPERTFKVSGIESSLLIARSPRGTDRDRPTSLRSTSVAQRDRDAFLRSGKITTSRMQIRPFRGETTGDLWIRELDRLWRYLGDYPVLGSLVDIHRGIEWRGQQTLAKSPDAKKGYRRGLHSADAVHPFVLDASLWLDTRPERIRRAGEISWETPKIITNAVRLRRGPWRLAAAVDANGLVCSQQLFGCWSESSEPDELAILASVLNGPVANAFVTIHSPAKGIRISTMRTLPVPPVMPREIVPLVDAYRNLLSPDTFTLDLGVEQKAAALLNEIDALVLKAYDLPPRLERELLEYFRGAERPTVHPWSHWLPDDFGPAIPLHEYLSDAYTKATGTWVLDLFRPLPEEEASFLREYIGHAEP